MRLWLDDERTMPVDFDVHVRTAAEAIDILKTQKVSLVSLDHDLGPPEAGTGYDVAKWVEQMAFYGALKRLEWRVHSANPVGRRNMSSSMENAERFWRRNEDAQEALVGDVSQSVFPTYSQDS
jgi:hypothetical protein